MARTARAGAGLKKQEFSREEEQLLEEAETEIKGHRSPGSSGQITDGVTHKGNSRSVTERRQLPLRHG